MAEQTALPEQRSKDRPRAETTRGWILYALSVVAMIVLYAIMKSGELRSFVGVLAAVFIGLPVLVFGVGMALILRRSRRHVAETNEALSAMNRGDLERAHKIYWTWSSSRVTSWAALARHNLAWTSMRQAQVEQAAQIAADVLARHEASLKSMSLWPTTMIDSALFHGLLGDLEAARARTTRLDQEKELKHNVTFPAMNACVRAVIACREGNPGEAARLLEDRWTEYERMMSGADGRILRIVRAFAIASANVRDVGRAEKIIGDMQPAIEASMNSWAWDGPRCGPFSLLTSSCDPRRPSPSRRTSSRAECLSGTRPRTRSGSSTHRSLLHPSGRSSPSCGAYVLATLRRPRVRLSAIDLVCAVNDLDQVGRWVTSYPRT